MEGPFSKVHFLSLKDIGQFLGFFAEENIFLTFGANQGTLAEGEGSVRWTSSLQSIACFIRKK